MLNSQQPHGLQPIRLLHPWDFPGKSTGVGCHCFLQKGYLAGLILNSQQVVRGNRLLFSSFKVTVAYFTSLRFIQRQNISLRKMSELACFEVQHIWRKAGASPVHNQDKQGIEVISASLMGVMSSGKLNQNPWTSICLWSGAPLAWTGWHVTLCMTDTLGSLFPILSIPFASLCLSTGLGLLFPETNVCLFFCSCFLVLLAHIPQWIFQKGWEEYTFLKDKYECLYVFILSP